MKTFAVLHFQFKRPCVATQWRRMEGIRGWKQQIIRRQQQRNKQRSSKLLISSAALCCSVSLLRKPLPEQVDVHVPKCYLEPKTRTRENQQRHVSANWPSVTWYVTQCRVCKPALLELGVVAHCWPGVAHARRILSRPDFPFACQKNYMYSYTWMVQFPPIVVEGLLAVSVQRLSTDLSTKGPKTYAKSWLLKNFARDAVSFRIPAEFFEDTVSQTVRQGGVFHACACYLSGFKSLPETEWRFWSISSNT